MLFVSLKHVLLYLYSSITIIMFIFLVVVKVKFNVDEVKVTEGDNATVTLCAMASGQYSTTLTVGVSCTPTNADGVDPGMYVIFCINCDCR